MSTQEAKDRLELLQGTLDLLILRTLIFGSRHDQGIARNPTNVRGKSCWWNLQWLEERGWISPKWGTSARRGLFPDLRRP
jgi:PadR family transcriptional regulator PadR